MPTAANAARYADIVRGKALLRDIIDVGSLITQDAFREPEDVSQALEPPTAHHRRLQPDPEGSSRPVSELAPGTLEMIQRLYEAEGEVTGVETGFEDLDRLTGFHKSDLVILAARPAMGQVPVRGLRDCPGRWSRRDDRGGFRGKAVLTLGDNLKLGWTRRVCTWTTASSRFFRVTTARADDHDHPHPSFPYGGWLAQARRVIGRRPRRGTAPDAGVRRRAAR